MSPKSWWFSTSEPFPPTYLALTEPDGLLTLSKNINAEMVLTAYHYGIFPWYSQEDPVLWWSPAKRLALFTDEFKISKSLKKLLNKIAREENNSSPDYLITTNIAFNKVIQACAQKRKNQEGTWIQDEIIQTYNELHQAGYAHSVEVWFQSELVGGLYGMNLGSMFFGESMFSIKTDASKVALAYLNRFLLLNNVPLIDCQQETAHLKSLGARVITRHQFEHRLQHLITKTSPIWQADILKNNGTYATSL